MPVQYTPIESLEPSQNVQAVYQLMNFQVRPKKDGGQFVSMLLRDSTGRISGMLWDNIEGFQTGKYADNDYLEVTGSAQLYKEQLQLRVTRVRKVSESEVDSSRFLPVSPRDLTQMREEFKQRVAEIADTDYRQIVESVFGNKEYMDSFEKSAAGVMMHHAYIHGLLEHTLGVASVALKIADNYPQVDRSLLLAAALLHDVGKVLEYSSDRSIVITDAGRLLGHISMGNALIEKHCTHFPDIPADKKVLLQHCLLSHHGEFEFGSPKRPKLPEALILHVADLIDAQLTAYYTLANSSGKGRAKWSTMAMLPMFDHPMFFMGDEDSIEGADQLSRFEPQ